MLTLRDLQSSETFVVHPEGAIIGRDGGENDIAVRDKSVSKKHAKLYEKSGKWFLEDLQSANGTYIDDRRISKPTPIQVGLAFSLSNYQFEVVEIGGDTYGDAAQPATRVGSRPDMDSADGGADWMPEETAPPPKGAKGKAPPRKPVGSVSRSKGGGGDAIPQKGVGEVLAIMPKAIAHYMATIPLLLLNPIGTVRKSVEDQKFDAMGPIELIGWGLPAGLLGWIVGVVLAVLGGVVGMIRNFSGDAVIALLTATIKAAVGGLIFAVIGAVIGGFLLHPVLGWIVQKLKGESDAVSRSNFFIIAQAAAAILTMASGLGGFVASLLGLIPVAIVWKIGAALAILIGGVGTILIVYTSWQWFKFFQVVKWFQILVMIGVIGAAVMPALNAVTALTAKTGTGTGMVAAGGGTSGANPTPIKTGGSAKATPMPTRGASDDDAADDDDATAAPTAAAKATPAPTPIKVASSGSYGQFVTKRDAVEKAISDDPTILKRDKLLEQYYRQYHREVAAVKRAHPIRNQAEAVVEQRLIEAEIYEKTSRIVDQLYARVPKGK